MGTHGKKTRVLVGAYDLSAFLNDASASRTVDKAECSGFSATYKQYVLGLTDGTVSLGGYFSGTAGEADAILNAAFGDETTPPAVTILRDGYSTVGNRAELASAMETDYEVASSIGDAVTISASFVASGGLVGGLLLHPLQNESANSNSAGVDQTTVSTTFGGVAHLHVTAAAGTALIAAVEDSADNVSFTPIITFASTGAVGFERKTYSGTVRRYVRCAWTRSTGNFTFAVAFHRYLR